MPNVRKNATKKHRTPVSRLGVLSGAAGDRLREARALSQYNILFGWRGVGQPKDAVVLRSRGNPADKVLAERRATAVLRHLHREELVSIYEAELDYIEAGGE